MFGGMGMMGMPMPPMGGPIGGMGMGMMPGMMGMGMPGMMGMGMNPMMTGMPGTSMLPSIDVVHWAMDRRSARSFDAGCHREVDS